MIERNKINGSLLIAAAVILAINAVRLGLSIQPDYTTSLKTLTIGVAVGGFGSAVVLAIAGLLVIDRQRFMWLLRR